MSAKIIPFNPNNHGCTIKGSSNLYLFTDAAWLYAKALLWPAFTPDRESVKQAKTFIKKYFEATRCSTKSFIAFCERVALTNRYLAANPKRYVPSPEVWLNPFYDYGFCGTLAWLRQVNKQRQVIPGYMDHINVLANHYLTFIQRPCRDAVTACQEKLSYLGAEHMLKEFYAAVVMFTYYNK